MKYLGLNDGLEALELTINALNCQKTATGRLYNVKRASKELARASKS
jgi:hypothetical protein